MAQSLSQLFIHATFHIKTTSVKIRKEDSDELYAYIGQIIKDSNSIPIMINGVSDHLHLLFSLSKNISLSKIIEDVKRHSSRWIKTKGDYYNNFAWQNGYAGFSVSASSLDRTKIYIQNQEQHHKKMSFQEEYLLFLKEYGIDFNEKYLWTD